MTSKENYLLTIFKEHRNNPYNIYRLSMCGGCIEIEKRLYICMEEDLGIICNLNTYKKWLKDWFKYHPDLSMSLNSKLLLRYVPSGFWGIDPLSFDTL